MCTKFTLKPPEVASLQSMWFSRALLHPQLSRHEPISCSCTCRQWCSADKCHKIHTKVSLARMGRPSAGNWTETAVPYLVVFQQLRPLLLVRRGNEVVIHVERHWVQMNGPNELKAFELSCKDQENDASDLAAEITATSRIPICADWCVPDVQTPYLLFFAHLG